MRRAVWRARPNDPRTVLGWAARDGGYGKLPLWLAFLMMAALGALSTWTPWALLAAPPILLRVRRPPAQVDLGALRTLPPPGPAFDCWLKIERGSENVVTGMDEGVVTFVDGWLHYAGLRTDFSLRAADVRGLGEDGPGPRMLLQDVTVEFVAISLLQRAEFERATKLWYRSSAAEGESPTLPPRGVHPSGVARAWLEVAQTVSTSLAVSVFFLWILRVFLGSLSNGIVAGMFFAGLGSSFERVKALRRLVREEREALADERWEALGP